MQLEPLFIEAEGSQRTSIKMPDSVSEWPDFIINQLYKEHPSLSGKDADVVFKNRDEEQGYAVGSVKITDRGTPVLEIPFVIEARQLFPLDLFFSRKIDNKPHPLTEDRIRDVFFHTRMMEGLAPTPRAGDITSAIEGFNEDVDSYQYKTPPTSMGISKWGSQREPDWTSEVPQTLLNERPEDGLLKEALQLCTSDRIEAFRDDLLCVEGAIALDRLEKIGVDSGLKQIAMNFDKVPSREMLKQAMLLDSAGIETVRVRKMGADDYTIWMSYSNGGMSKTAKADIKETRTVLETVSGNPVREMQDIERSGEKIISAIRTNPDASTIKLTDELVPEEFIPAPSGYKRVNVFDPRVRGAMKGHLFGNVISPSGKSNGGKLFFNNEMYAYQPRMAVEAISGTLKDSKIAPIDSGFPRTGGTGTLVETDPEGNFSGKAMVPFQVRQTISDYDTEAFRIETITGKRATLIFSNVVSIRPIGVDVARTMLGALGSPNEQIYLIPRQYKYVTLGIRKEVANTPKEAIKTASDVRADAIPIDIVYDESAYFVRGGFSRNPQFIEKLGYNMSALDKNQALHTLAILGTPVEVAERALSKVAQIGKISVHGVRKPYASEDNFNTETTEVMFAKLAQELKPLENFIDSFNLLKIASAVPDVATVNTILSLKLVGPETFHMFARNIPLLEAALSFLGTLLLYSRLDSSLDLDETEISSGIRLVDNVVQKLNKAKAVLAPT